MFCKFPTDSSASPFKDCELPESRRDQGHCDDLDVSSAPSYFLTTSPCTASMALAAGSPVLEQGGSQLLIGTQLLNLQETWPPSGLAHVCQISTLVVMTSFPHSLDSWQLPASRGNRHQYQWDLPVVPDSEGKTRGWPLIQYRTPGKSNCIGAPSSKVTPGKKVSRVGADRTRRSFCSEIPFALGDFRAEAPYFVSEKCRGAPAACSRGHQDLCV